VKRSHQQHKVQQQSPHLKKISIKCSVCGKIIFNEADATRHATQTKHAEFEEYIAKPGEEPVEPEQQPRLSDEEKQKQLEMIQAKIKEKKQTKTVELEKQELEKEKQRRTNQKELIAARDKWKEEKERKDAEQSRREKIAEEKAKEEVQKKVLEDKLRREQQAGRAKVQNPVAPTTTTQPQQPQAQSTAKKNPAEYDQCIIQVRLTNGQRLEGTFKPTDTLDKVFEYIQKNRTDGSAHFVLTMSYPRKTFSAEVGKMTLLEADLVPRAMLILTKL